MSSTVPHSPPNYTSERAKVSTGTVASPWPHFDEDEIDAVNRVLRSGKVNYWTGEEGKAFEKEFADYTGTRYAVAVANGTVALELALKILGIEPGDHVITTSRTFIASASSIVAVGAQPILADVDRDSQNLTADSIRRALTPATKAIIVVHLAGWPCEMDEIIELARECNLKVIEDCAQAHGATYKGRRVGSIADVGAFSFCQDKIMTTAGEGGMITLNSEELFERAWAYKDHGKSYEAVYRRTHAPGFRWLHESFGTNWRLSEVQSAIGRLQLRKLPVWVGTRQQYAAQLQSSLARVASLRVPIPPEYSQHAFYKFYSFIRPDTLHKGWDRDRILSEIASQGIQCFQGSCSEIYLEKAFPPEWRPDGGLSVARELGHTSLMFLVHPTLSPEYIVRTADVISDVMHRATGSIPEMSWEYETKRTVQL